MTLAASIPSDVPSRTLCLADACGGRRRGVMLVLSSPSGAGKSTLCRALLELNPHLVPSVSVTTRPPRPGEMEGRDYHFITLPEFQRLAAGEGLLEYAKVFDNYYGTPRRPVADALARGCDVLFDIDWQGHRKLKNGAPTDVVGVFILPPSVAELECRLRGRGQDDITVIAHRMAKAVDEIGHWDEYRYVVINRTVQHSVAAVAAILETERLRRQRQIDIPALVAEMRDATG
ncbi:MAG: guanylate kinase [Rhodospirillaceae bacterium]|nr:MAG: guanylate kinase [Rhodospirillaceae bacterium]